MSSLVVVVDMVNGFINKGNLADKNINKITPNIVSIVKSSIEKNIPIIDFRDCHNNGDEEFNIFPVHCLKGTYESELIDELKPYKNKFYDIEKNTTNGFNTDKFLKIASRNNFKNVYICGCCTDICVKEFVLSYLKFNKIYNRQTNIIVIKDACYTFDGQNHNAEEMHNKAIYEMENAGAKIISLNKEYTK